MNCERKVISKIIVVRCGKYSLFGFRFGPTIYIKIEVCYHECGKFTASIIEGKNIKNFEKIFKEDIEGVKKEIVRELTFAIRRKNIVKELEERKKIGETSKIRDLNKGAFDELTTRMRVMRREVEKHPCLIKKNDIVIKDGEIESEYENYFGDTTKIVNRKTRKD